MVKVYDMVTFGVRESDGAIPTQGFGSPQDAAVPTLELQLVEAIPTPRSHAMPASLRNIDVASFLAAFDD